MIEIKRREAETITRKGTKEWPVIRTE